MAGVCVCVCDVGSLSGGCSASTFPIIATIETVNVIGTGWFNGQLLDYQFGMRRAHPIFSLHWVKQKKMMLMSIGGNGPVDGNHRMPIMLTGVSLSQGAICILIVKCVAALLVEIVGGKKSALLPLVIESH